MLPAADESDHITHSSSNAIHKSVAGEERSDSRRKAAEKITREREATTESNHDFRVPPSLLEEVSSDLVANQIEKNEESIHQKDEAEVRLRVVVVEIAEVVDANIAPEEKASEVKHEEEASDQSVDTLCGPLALGAAGSAEGTIAALRRKRLVLCHVIFYSDRFLNWLGFYTTLIRIKIHLSHTLLMGFWGFGVLGFWRSGNLIFGDNPIVDIFRNFQIFTF